MHAMRCARHACAAAAVLRAPPQRRRCAAAAPRSAACAGVADASAPLARQAAAVETGDIVIVQRALCAAEAAASRFPLAPAFMSHVRNRLVVTFRELPGAAGAAAPGGAAPGAGPAPPAAPPGCHTLELSRALSYDDVAAALAAALGLPDATHLRFTEHSLLTNGPKTTPLRFRERPTLLGLLTPPFGNPSATPCDVLYYEPLDMPLEQLEALKTLRITWHDASAQPGRVLTCRVPKSSTVGELLDALRLQLGREELPSDAACADADATSAPLRLLDIYCGKVYKLYRADESIEYLNDTYSKLRAEAVPADQVDAALGPGDRLLNVSHVRRESGIYVSMKAFGDPFLLKVHDAEPLRCVRARIRALLRLPDAPEAAPAAEPAADVAADVASADVAIAEAEPEAEGDSGAAAPAPPPAPPPPPPASAAAFDAWRWCVVSLGKPEYFTSDDDEVGARFGRLSRDASFGSAFDTYLGMEHEEPPRGKRAAADKGYRSGYDKGGGGAIVIRG
jgi:hypothetical protein